MVSRTLDTNSLDVTSGSTVSPIGRVRIERRETLQGQKMRTAERTGDIPASSSLVPRMVYELIVVFNAIHQLARKIPA